MNSPQTPGKGKVRHRAKETGPAKTKLISDNTGYSESDQADSNSSPRSSANVPSDVYCVDLAKFKDVTGELARLQRGQSLLFRTKDKENGNSHYAGVIALSSGSRFWAHVWLRKVSKASTVVPVLELRLIPHLKEAQP